MNNEQSGIVHRVLQFRQASICGTVDRSSLSNMHSIDHWHQKSVITKRSRCFTATRRVAHISSDAGSGRNYCQVGNWNKEAWHTEPSLCFFCTFLISLFMPSPPRSLLKRVRQSPNCPCPSSGLPRPPEDDLKTALCMIDYPEHISLLVLH